MKRVGIVGAGRFGGAMVESLARGGADMILIDRDHERIQRFADIVSNAVSGDATDPQALMEAGFQECDTAVIAIGADVEGSILATMNLKELGVSYIVAKAGSEMHGKVLERIGAGLVVYPEKERAQRLARTLLAGSALDYFRVSDDVSLVEIRAPDEFCGKTLIETGIREKFGVTILAITSGEEGSDERRSVISPAGNDIIERGDTILLFGSDSKIEAVSGLS